jgi:subtilisin family serine protease
LDNVISVGSINRFGEIADDSGTGEHIDLCAPGVEIRSTIGNNGYWVMSGTSMATPHVSGTASLLSGFNQNLSNDDIATLVSG